MGYETFLEGEFTCSPALTGPQIAYLQAFNDSRRMQRNPEITVGYEDPVRIAAGLPIGKDACYFVGDLDSSSDIVDYNRPPRGQPGLWCQWRPSDDGTSIAWDENEKFYNYVDWIKYIVIHFLIPWGVEINGIVSWDGEDHGDHGRIRATHNKIETRSGYRSFAAGDPNE